MVRLRNRIDLDYCNWRKWLKISKVFCVFDPKDLPLPYEDQDVGKNRLRFGYRDLRIVGFCHDYGFAGSIAYCAPLAFDFWGTRPRCPVGK
jgi:hypothetical protein